jgi:glutamate carboxypeptidase
VPGTSFEITGGMNRYPLEPNPRNRALWHAAERCARRLGLEIGEGTAGGGSDGNFTSEHAATLDGLGAVGDGAHAVHEHVVIDRMPERAALLAGLLLEPVA